MKINEVVDEPIEYTVKRNVGNKVVLSTPTGEEVEVPKSPNKPGAISVNPKTGETEVDPEAIKGQVNVTPEKIRPGAKVKAATPATNQTPKPAPNQQKEPGAIL